MPAAASRDEALQIRSVRSAQNLPTVERIPDTLEDRSGPLRLLAGRRHCGRSDRLFENGRGEQHGRDRADGAQRGDHPARHVPTVEENGPGCEEREGSDEFGKHPTLT